MSLLDELKKWTHPYEDEDEEYDDFEEPVRQNAFEDRKLKVEDRRNKVVNIHATTQLKVVLVKPERPLFLSGHEGVTSHYADTTGSFHPRLFQGSDGRI